MKIDSSLGLLGVLLEPTTVVTKAWEQVDAIGRRAFWDPSTVLITGAGPIGLLAALLGMQRGLDVHVLGRVNSGIKPDLVHALGASYHAGAVAGVRFRPDIIIERTGAGPVISDSIQGVANGGVCLTGIGSGDRSTGVPTAGDIAAEVVLRNNVIVGQRQRQQAALV
jgi:threonine dehydrogenase-like Zn-dependent dehydrogenase